ncbi:hypothetical protein GCK32_019758, partial [Trichostrongylus colubriformis]
TEAIDRSTHQRTQTQISTFPKDNELHSRYRSWIAVVLYHLLRSLA